MGGLKRFPRKRFRKNSLCFQVFQAFIEIFRIMLRIYVSMRILLMDGRKAGNVMAEALSPVRRTAPYRIDPIPAPSHLVHHQNMEPEQI